MEGGRQGGRVIGKKKRRMGGKECVRKGKERKSVKGESEE